MKIKHLFYALLLSACFAGAAVAVDGKNVRPSIALPMFSISFSSVIFPQPVHAKQTAAASMAGIISFFS